MPPKVDPETAELRKELEDLYKNLKVRIYVPVYLLYEYLSKRTNQNLNGIRICHIRQIKAI